MSEPFPHQERNKTVDPTPEFESIIGNILQEIPDSFVDIKSELTKIKNMQCEYGVEGTVESCLNNLLDRAKSMIVTAIENLEVTSHAKVKSKMEVLKQSLDLSANETDAAVKEVFAAANEELQEKWKDLAKRVGSGELDDLIPDKISVLDRISFVITNMRFDFEEGKYQPEYLLISRGSGENLLAVQNILMDIHRYLLIAQTQYSGQNLLEFLMSKSCSLVENTKYNCSYNQCELEAVGARVKYLFDSQEIGYEFMKVLTIFTCQRQSMTKAGKNYCLTGGLVDSIENEKKKTLTSQRGEWANLLRGNADRKSSCDCRVGEYKTFANNGTEILCEKCPVGTYNLVEGASSCLECPKTISKGDDSFKQCLNSKFKRISDTLRTQRAKLSDAQSLVNDLKEEIREKMRGKN